MKIPITAIQMIRTALTPEQEQEVQELADSIKDVGLSHPIIVRATNIPELPYALVSGAKRIYAHERNSLTEIEAEIRETTEIGGQIIRLHENLRRTNLPWFEMALLVEQLHELRRKEHGQEGEVKRGAPRKDEGPRWGVRETAEELGRALGPVTEDLQLARAVRNNPALRNVADRKTAVRLVRQEVQRRTSEMEASAPSEGVFNQAFCGDSETVLKHLPDKSIDHVVTDPPWLRFFDASLTLDARTLPVFRECYRVLKNNSFMLVFCGLDDYHYYCGTDSPGPDGSVVHTKGELEKIGFTVSKTPAIWRKGNALSRRGVRSWEYDRDFEFVIVAVKGSPVMVHPTVVSSFKDADAVPVRSLIHPNEKPVSLIRAYLEDISYEGNLILDPFGGSFVTAQACKETKRRWIVIERDQQTYQKGCARLGIQL